MTTIYTSTLDSPLGTLYLAHTKDVLYALEFSEFHSRFAVQLASRFPQFSVEAGPHSPVIRQLLQAYFAGEIHRLAEIPVQMHGTPFQERVWQGLRTIPAGQTVSYQQLAQTIGSTNGQRAVGSANGKNPIPLVVPCHRVITAHGHIGGYGGAVWRKEWLLKHEGVLL